MFRNLLIADSGKGHVEEMIRMLQDIPSLKAATTLDCFLNVSFIFPDRLPVTSIALSKPKKHYRDRC